MTARRFNASAFLIVTTCSAAAYGVDTGTSDPAVHRRSDSHVQVSLVSQTTALRPQASTLLGVHFKIEPGWHIYWNGLNDTGQAPIIKLNLPEGYTQTPIQWPAPKRHVGNGDILDHIYEDSVTLIIGVTPPATAKPETKVTLSLHADWLVCSDVCVPEDGSAELTLPIERDSGSAPALSRDADLFNPVKTVIPAMWGSAPSHASLQWKDRVLTITSLIGPRIEFYPGAQSTPPINPVKSAASRTGKLVLRFDVASDEPARAEGIVAIWPQADGKPKYYNLDTTPDDTAKPGPESPK